MRRGDLMPGAGWDEDGVAGSDGARFAVDLHHARALQDEVELLGQLVMVPLGGSTGGNRRLGERLLLHGRIGAVEDAADRGTVLGREGLLPGKLVDRHGCVVNACRRISPKASRNP